MCSLRALRTAHVRVVLCPDELDTLVLGVFEDDELMWKFRKDNAKNEGMVMLEMKKMVMLEMK